MRASRISELRICELSELADDAALAAREMKNDGCSAYEILSVVSESLSEVFSGDAHGDCLEANKKRLSKYFSASDICDAAVFSSLFAERAERLGVLVCERDFFDTDGGDESIIYVKNSLADEAYDVFSESLSDPRVKYAISFKEACRAVAEGEAEYCLLPLEERGGARLSGIRELIFRHDLKINAVTPVFGFDGVADMKYALISKHFTLPEVLEDDDRYLEIMYKRGSECEISHLLLASELLGYTVYRINTVTLDTEGESAPYSSIVFRAEGGLDFSVLLIFLSSFIGSYTAIGIYKNLE